MKVLCMAFTRKGLMTAERVRLHFEAHKDPCEIGAVKRLVSKQDDVIEISDIKDFVKIHFETEDVLVFVGACGIAVRLIAPYLTNKLHDPAVIVLDEDAEFVIPLIGGHVAGANEIASWLSQKLQAVCVLTTATDRNGVFAVDQWARSQGLKILEKDGIKEISSRLLNGQRVLFSPGSCQVQGNLPEGVDLSDGTGGEIGFAIGMESPFEKTLHLIPVCHVIGIGCKKNISYEKLKTCVETACLQAGIARESVLAFATIDRKADEPAILKLAADWQIPLRVYTADELSRVDGEFSSSEFVLRTVGVDNVCERAARAETDRIILPKVASEGVTVAIAARNMSFTFPS